MASLIEWLLGGETWNMILARNKETGKIGWFCEKIAPECATCYAESQNVSCGCNPGRYGNGIRYAADQRDKVEIFLSPKALKKPLHWRDPKYVFLCSMTDIFGNWVTDAMLDQIFAVMALCPQHTFIVLTKRPDLAYWYLSNPETRCRVGLAMVELAKTRDVRKPCPLPIEERPDSTEESPKFWATWPLPNVWLLASAGTQKTADEYLPWLIKSPAALHGVSAEPLLEMVDFSKWLRDLDWGILGGESGKKARTCHVDHVRSGILQFRSARKPIFVKQLGAVPVMSEKEWRKPGPVRLLSAKNAKKAAPGTVPLKLQDKKGGNPEEWPPNLRVREYPEVKHASV